MDADNEYRPPPTRERHSSRGRDRSVTPTKPQPHPVYELEEVFPEARFLDRNGEDCDEWGNPVAKNNDKPAAHPERSPSISPERGAHHPERSPSISPERGAHHPERSPSISPERGARNPSCSPSISPERGAGNPSRSPSISPKRDARNPSRSPSISPSRNAAHPDQSPSISPARKNGKRSGSRSRSRLSPGRGESPRMSASPERPSPRPKSSLMPDRKWIEQQQRQKFVRCRKPSDSLRKEYQNIVRKNKIKMVKRQELLAEKLRRAGHYRMPTEVIIDPPLDDLLAELPTNEDGYVDEAAVWDRYWDSCVERDDRARAQRKDDANARAGSNEDARAGSHENEPANPVPRFQVLRKYKSDKSLYGVNPPPYICRRSPSASPHVMPSKLRPPKVHAPLLRVQRGPSHPAASSSSGRTRSKGPPQRAKAGKRSPSAAALPPVTVTKNADRGRRQDPMFLGRQRSVDCAHAGQLSVATHAQLQPLSRKSKHAASTGDIREKAHMRDVGNDLEKHAKRMRGGYLKQLKLKNGDSESVKCLEAQMRVNGSPDRDGMHSPARDGMQRQDGAMHSPPREDRRARHSPQPGREDRSARNSPQPRRQDRSARQSPPRQREDRGARNSPQPRRQDRGARASPPRRQDDRGHRNRERDDRHEDERPRNKNGVALYDGGVYVGRTERGFSAEFGRNGSRGNPLMNSMESVVSASQLLKQVHHNDKMHSTVDILEGALVRDDFAPREPQFAGCVPETVEDLREKAVIPGPILQNLHSRGPEWAACAIQRRWRLVLDVKNSEVGNTAAIVIQHHWRKSADARRTRRESEKEHVLGEPVGFADANPTVPGDGSDVFALRSQTSHVNVDMDDVTRLHQEIHGT